MLLSRKITLSFFSLNPLYFLLPALGLNSTMLSTSPYGSTMLLEDLACRAYLFRISSFHHREKDTLISTCRFCDQSCRVAFFKESKSNLNGNLFYRMKKSWRLHLHISGSNTGPIQTKIYKVYALPLSKPAPAWVPLIFNAIIYYRHNSRYISKT